MEIAKIQALNKKMENAIEKLLPELEEVYKDIHRHPELSMQEFRTSRIAADYLAQRLL